MATQGLGEKTPNPLLKNVKGRTGQRKEKGGGSPKTGRCSTSNIINFGQIRQGGETVLSREFDGAAPGSFRLGMERTAFTTYNS